MIVRCVEPLPTPAQAKVLGAHYIAGKQQFGVVVGVEYVVFALKLLGGQPWIDITDPDLEPGYLFGAPLCLFEIVDARVPYIWQARIGNTGELRIAPSSFFRDYYYDDLFEGIADVVADFRAVRRQLEDERLVDKRKASDA
jgi:hypothetical protein